ncbi:hypothetical protein GX411_09355 [Candidatus Fermentibacteria bacterium]|nr:hypothetical protein [Candidatus Fermentibacteria bacterium]
MRLLPIVILLAAIPVPGEVMELEIDGAATARIPEGSVIVDVFRGGGASLGITCGGERHSFAPASSAVGFVFRGTDASLFMTRGGSVILQIEVPEQPGGAPERLEIPADGSPRVFEARMMIESVISVPQWESPSAPLFIEIDGQQQPQNIFDPASEANGFVVEPGFEYCMTCEAAEGSFVLVRLVEI